MSDNPTKQELAPEYGVTRTTIVNLSPWSPPIFAGLLNIEGHRHFFTSCHRLHTNVAEVYDIIWG